MKKIFWKLILFSLPAIIYSVVAILFMPYFISLTHGPSTKKQIAQSFRNAVKRNYELIILGNSRTYRGINPDKLNYKSYNFSHDNDSYNQIYYKLKFVIENKKNIKYLVLGVDYFQFSFKSDTRNYAYGDLLGSDYMNDYDENRTFVKRIEYYIQFINPRKFLSVLPEDKTPFLRDNGQYIRPGIDEESYIPTRDIKRLKFQVNYFEKTLSLCKKNKIKVVLLNLPTREIELGLYKSKDIIEFDEFINSHVDNTDIFYLNLCRLKGFTSEDYTDINHFNEKAADRFSEILNEKIIELNIQNR